MQHIRFDYIIHKGGSFPTIGYADMLTAHNTYWYGTTEENERECVSREKEITK